MCIQSFRVLVLSRVHTKLVKFTHVECHRSFEVSRAGAGKKGCHLEWQRSEPISGGSESGMQRRALASYSTTNTNSQHTWMSKVSRNTHLCQCSQYITKLLLDMHDDLVSLWFI